jgi:5-carboxymethyl-2-hydroxymuconate isomerase
VHKAVGETLAATIREELAPLLARRPVGLTLQVDEGHEVFDAKLGNLHALFVRK